jgi:hypothetical protein
MLYWITPSLALTDDPLDPIEDPPEALATILGGHDAFVDTPANVRTVLMALGLSEDEVTDKIDFAMGLKSIDSADVHF